MIDREELARLGRLHRKRAAGGLDPFELVAYRESATRLLAGVVEADRRGQPPQRRRRKSIRLPRSIRVDLCWDGGRCRVLTRNVGLGGFGAMLAEPLPGSGSLEARLELRRGESVRATVDVRSVRHAGRRASFEFVSISPADRERLDVFLVGEFLAAFEGTPAAPDGDDPSLRSGLSGRALVGHGAVGE
jgi:hypothetical protein